MPDANGRQTRGEIAEVIKLAMLKTAPRTVVIRYQAAGGEISQRTVEPYKLTDTQLTGWCLNKNATRRFDLSGIMSASEGEAFMPRFPLESVV